MNVNSGLEGVIAAETVLSEVDGQAGRLTIRGHLLEQLTGHCSFEAVLQILLDGFLEPTADEAAFRVDLARARAQVFALLPLERESCRRLPPIEVLRAWIAQLPDGDDRPAALQLLAAPAVFTAAILRIRAGAEPVAPEPSLRHAADVLQMLRNSPVEDYEAAALDSYLVTVADHGLNASTFAARVVASTRAGLTSAVIAALSALKGPLHGGAPGPVLDMLDAIGQPERAGVWIEAALQRDERLMGFGHRVYRVRDPRADALRAALDTNVEFYTALLLEALGVPREAFTCMFAVGRVGGWIAHAREQVRCGRLIRPQSRYIGPAPAPAAA
jgi:citrate synthase